MGTEVPPPPPPPKHFWGDTPDEDEFYASQGVRYRSSYFLSPHGRLFTHSFLPVDPSSGALLPVKALVFMSHGYGSDAGWMFQKIAIAYATWGYAVHCADLLGHGRSDGIRCYLGDMEAVAGASLSFFLSVRREHPDLPAFLFGESMGGAATLLMYLRSDPGVWTGLIFSAPLFVIPDEMKPSKLHLVVYGLLFGLADTWAVMPSTNMVVKSVKDRERLKIILANPRRYTGPPRVGTMRELARLCEYLQANFHKVGAPFLTVHGTDDGMAEAEGSKLLYEKAAIQDKKLILYEGMYHSLIQGETEENSERVLAGMRAWIGERVERYGTGASKVIELPDGGKVAAEKAS